MIESLAKFIYPTIMGIEQDFRIVKGLILTEDDLKCILYSRLSRIRRLSNPITTQDKEILATSIHTELKWYDDDGKLTIVPDITILEPRHLSILHMYRSNLRLPSKQYSFGGKAIIFELKFCRNKMGITTNYFKNEIRADYDKIVRLFNRLDSQGLPNDIFCYFVIFNKTNLVCEEFTSFISQYGESDRHKVIYCTGMVKFG